MPPIRYILQLADATIQKFTKENDYDLEAGMEHMVALNESGGHDSNGEEGDHDSAIGQKEKQEEGDAAERQRLNPTASHGTLPPSDQLLATNGNQQTENPVSSPPTYPSTNAKNGNLSIPQIHQVLEMVEKGHSPESVLPASSNNDTNNGTGDADTALNKDPQQYHDQLRATAQTAANEPVPMVELETSPTVKKNLYAMGATTAVAIALHNFPEGLVTFVAYLEDPAVGVSMAIAIAMHNIPEGLCVAMPIYYATSSRWKAFLWGCFSGFSEPLGALFGWLILQNSISGTTYGALFGFVSGMMIYISMDELLPMAFKFDPTGSIITWTSVAGMLLVALSVILFKLG